MSTNKRIVFTTWGSFGDVHPFMGLAREMKARGHRPAIATLSQFREKIESAGIDFYPLRPDDYPPNTTITGFPFYDGKEEQPAPRELMQFLENGEPPILFTLGSAAVRIGEDFFRTSIEVARRLKRRALLLVGDNLEIRGELPEGVAVFNYAPYSAVMPRSAVIVHQSGIGTTGQALRAGRPMLIVPYGQDQPDNARRCVELGVGELLASKDYTTASALALLEQLLSDPSYAANARRVALELRQEDGTRTACDVIESVLTDAATVMRTRKRQVKVALPRLAYTEV